MRIREELSAIAMNLWWSWTPDAQELFRHLAPELWKTHHHNPLAVLRRVSDARLRLVFADPDARTRLERVRERFHRELSGPPTFAKGTGRGLDGKSIVYLCAEFGLHESLPLYSGGLGILAGDHLKTASDLGLPLTAIGLRYPEGFFRQRVDGHGWQHEDYPVTPWEDVPATQVLDDAGEPLRIRIPIAGTDIDAHLWRVDIGRIPLYLLDTDVPGNAPDDRRIGSRLYSGDHTTRIRQEIVLGVGAVRAMRALDIDPDVLHLNEGHCAFAALELMRERIAAGSTFDDALEHERRRILFTTHTPVPAGHDRFPQELVSEQLASLTRELGVPSSRLIGLGRVNPSDASEWFCMTVLAMKTARHINGVSALHGRVTREMWQALWPDLAVEDIPVHHVTNGIHVETFMHPRLRVLVEERIGADWGDALLDPPRWAAFVDGLGDEDLVELRRILKADLLLWLQARQSRRGGVHGLRPTHGAEGLRLDTLTIGFARRFATYKRGAMLFSDYDRARALLTHAERPVQILFAGKAHPQDGGGKEVIRRIVGACNDPSLQGHVIFLEDYDMNVARALVSGVDVWLNTPRRPREASGTSGQKVNMHGVLNASILDGWWAEGFDGTNGWAIGDHEEPASEAEQDERDTARLYEVLEGEIIASWYGGASPGASPDWVGRMRASMRTLPCSFSSRRMLQDYVSQHYLPLLSEG